MWFTPPKRYVGLKTASALADARPHIGKEIVEVRSIRDFTIWRVADVCLSPNVDAVEVHYELIVGRGKDRVETLFSHETWSHSYLLEQFVFASTGCSDQLIEALRSGEVVVHAIVDRGGQTERLELEPTYWWINRNEFGDVDEYDENGQAEYVASHNQDGYQYSIAPDEVRLWGEKLPGKMFVERSELERLFPPQTVQPRRERLDEPSDGYLPPFVAFMIGLVAKLGLRPDGREKKDTIEEFIRQNWLPELGQPSSEKVSYMATFLRPPDHQKGGNFRTAGSPARSRGSDRPAPRKVKGRTI
jgi:hypothetical protein